MLHIFCPHCGELRSEEEFHAAGCRQYFNATRDTVTYEILETYKIGTKPQVTGKGTAPQLVANGQGEKV